ncbi:MAG TPA: hypothetical protein PLT45_06760 [Smithella sp.]|nr:hypothetical protein [Smithella sp.]
MEERIWIPGEAGVIEALMSAASMEKAAVICHPHSLMGGSMYNNVVEAIQRAFAAENHTTLRFNFRGVGASGGRYDEGVGEQADLRAVCAYLKKRGIKNLIFAGYSFGSWVGSKVIAAQDNPFAWSFFVSPPMDYFDFDWESLKGKVDFILCGDADSFCDAGLLKNQARGIKADVKIISGADHFYVGKEKALISVLREKLCRQAGKKN